MLEDMTVGEAHIILHASGLSNGTRQYREHYVIRPDHPVLLKLVQDGYFIGPINSPSSFNAQFFLTPKGKTAAMDLASRFNSFRCNCVGKDEEE